MEFDCDIDKLVLLVKDRRALYDYNMREHSNKKIIEKLWKEISNELGASVAECKTKWHSLRNSYARALREEKSSDSGVKKRKKWYMADTMSFLNGFMNPRAKLSLDNHDDDSIDDLSGTPESVEVDVEVGDVLGWDVKQSRQQSEKCALPSVKIYSMDEKISKFTNTDSVFALRTDKEDDPDLSFFKSLLPDFKRLSGKRKRCFKEMTLISLNHLVDEEEGVADECHENKPSVYSVK